jgi:hypothetical protein
VYRKSCIDGIHVAISTIGCDMKNGTIVIAQSKRSIGGYLLEQIEGD